MTRRLNEKRIVVWYDGECAFGDFIARFSASNCHVVSAQASRLQARREAEAVYRQLNASPNRLEAEANLLIYLPFARHTDPDKRRRDPFEVFAMAGDSFGDDEAETLQSLAHQAMPELTAQVDRLFSEGQPTLAMLDRLDTSGPAYPLCQQTLGTQSPVAIAARLLGDGGQTAVLIANTPGCRPELLRLLRAGLGFAPPDNLADSGLWALLGRYLLLSEFAFDLPGPLPDALTGQAVAGEEYRAAVLATAARLRDHTSHQEAYLALAKEVAETLRLPAYFTSHDQIGQIDTFAFEETLYLDKLGAALLAGDLAAARQILQGRQSSIWRQQPERQPLWRMAERCLALQETVTAVQSQLSAHPVALGQLLAAYSAPDGWQQLDRQQRLLEQSVATCPDAEPLNAVIDHCRQLYRELAERIQGEFLTAVQQAGWPPAGYLRQSQVFAHYVAPALARREKVVYVLADSLRLEMGYDLAQALADLGDAACDVVTAHLPTVTPFGMAALLPGADGALHLRDDGGSLTPYLGETRLKDIQDRKKFLSEKLGDRAIDVEISEFLSLNSTKKRQSRVKNSDLVILRDGRIDRFGESVPGYEARKYISGLLGDLKTAVTHLIRLGYSYIVIATDHGHVFLPEILPGDTVTQPLTQTGWPLAKRRCLMGTQIETRPGNLVFTAAHLGLSSDAPDYITPVGLKVYSQGSGYFHEGLSLPEAVLPLVTLQAKTPSLPPQAGMLTVDLRYKRDFFTGQIIALQAQLSSIVTPLAKVRLEAFDAANNKVGEAADCAARDDITYEVTLRAGEETAVPILLAPDFHGDAVEIRATDGETGVVYGRLTLKNGMME